MSSAPLTRPSLLLRLRNAEDEEAWRDFIRLYTPLVFGHCKRRGLGDADAADVAQEVMRFVVGAMGDFVYEAERGRFRSWLLQVTRNRLHKFFTKQRRLLVTTGDTAVQRVVEEAPGPDEQARWDEEYRQRLFDWAVEEVRDEFQASTWEAFWLSAKQSVSVKEVSSRLGISVGAIYVARSRVIARLRELIEEVADEPTSGPGARNGGELPHS